jgi:hypothetical protein
MLCWKSLLCTQCLTLVKTHSFDTSLHHDFPPAAHTVPTESGVHVPPFKHIQWLSLAEDAEVECQITEDVRRGIIVSIFGSSFADWFKNCPPLPSTPFQAIH